MKHLFLFLTDVVEQAPEVVEETFNFGEMVAKIFTPELIATIIAMIGALSSIFALIGNARKLAKQNSGTIKDVISALNLKMDEKNDENITKVIAPLVNKMGKIEHTEEILIKVLALMQENSPESRIATLKLLQDVNVVQDETIVKAQENVAKQEEEKKLNQEKAIKELEEIERVEETKGRI